MGSSFAGANKNSASLNVGHKNFIFVSLVLHLALIFGSLFLPNSIKKLIFGERKQQVIREFVQVDIVGMPKFTKKELSRLVPEIDRRKSPVKNPSIPTNNTADSETIKNTSAKVKNTSIENFLSSMAQKKLPKYDGKKNNSAKPGKKTLKKSLKKLGKLQRLALEGNSLSTGAVAVGENTGFSNDDYQIYISSIPSQVRPFWSLPSYLAEQNLRARVKIRLDGNGRIISMDLVESSGVEEFDQRALQSIKSVKIFTTPSKSIRELLAIKGVILGFPL
mgnify:CR=1 FL=1|tara:strand:+ start:1246 stop:2076 length:831 start_codon:yes stop_codon:yes gene_type:complete